MAPDGAQDSGAVMHYVHTEDTPVREAAELLASRRQTITGTKRRQPLETPA